MQNKAPGKQANNLANNQFGNPSGKKRRQGGSGKKPRFASQPEPAGEEGSNDGGKVVGLPARRLAAVILTRVIDDKRNLDALTDMAHGLDPWMKLGDSEAGRKDQQLVRAILAICLRNRNRIVAILAKLLDRPLPKNARFLHHALHVAAAQILFMDVPDSAAVNIAVTMIGKDKRTARFKPLSNAILRRMVREKDELLAATEAIDPLPRWLSKQLRSDYGKQAVIEFGRTLMGEGAIDLTVKSDPAGWAQKLDGVVLPLGTVRLKTRKAVQSLEGFEDGEWWVQDVAATIPARVMGDIAGLEVADLCAAPGGKTAQLVLNGAKVTAVELVASRANRLKENLARLKLAAEIVEADIFQWETEKRFDAILLDVPCSSTGTLRHNPDVVWTRTAEEITVLAELQRKMVVKSADYLKPDGLLVFSNCSILKSEGEDLLASIAKSDCGLQPKPIVAGEFGELDPFINGQGAIRTLPTDLANIADGDPRLDGMDSFFCCRFVKGP